MNYDKELLLTQDYPKLGDLGTLKPISTPNKIPCKFELLLLSSNLNYQAKLIFDGEAKGTKNITPMECMEESIRLLAIVDDYENKYITHEEMKQIRKDFKLNSLYNR